MKITDKIKGWTTDTENRVSHLYFPITKWSKPTNTLVKLSAKYDFKIAELKNVLELIKKQKNLEPIIVNPKNLKKRRTYRGISLTARPHSLNPVYEGAQYFDQSGVFVSSAKSLGVNADEVSGSKKSDFEREFSEVNEVAPEFTEKLKKKFSNWIPTKIRIMELLPNGVIPPHYDHPFYNQIRIHTAIESNPDVFWEVEGKQFQIPVDGSFYWFDTGRVHSVYNLGKTTRTILSIHLCPPLDTNRDPVIDHFNQDFIENGL